MYDDEISENHSDLFDNEESGLRYVILSLCFYIQTNFGLIHHPEKCAYAESSLFPFHAANSTLHA
jgi:hypothetical protein